MTPNTMHVIAQVEEVIPFHELLQLPKITDRTIGIDLVNRTLPELENDILFVAVKEQDTNIDSVNQLMEDLSIDPNRYKKLMTLPVILATVAGSTDTMIYCFPLTNAILNVPKKGE